MLYLTTRDAHDTFTTARTLAGDRAPNGGLYLPFRLSKLNLAELRERSFGENVAEVLNAFFSTRLTGREVEFSVGRYPVKMANLTQSVQIAQLWRNLDGSYEKMERRLFAKIGPEGTVPSWPRIGIRIAVLCGVFSELMRMEAVDEKHPVDMALPAGDFSLNMAVWYGREMGLPIRKIICCCESNSVIWDLLHLGEMRTPGQAGELERLIYATLGVEEAVRYSNLCEKNGIFTVPGDQIEAVRRGMFAAVVSNDRRDKTISNVYRTNAWLLEPEAAGAYSALMDYRTKTGEKHKALILGDWNPADRAGEIAAAIHVSTADLNKILEKR